MKTCVKCNSCFESRHCDNCARIRAAKWYLENKQRAINNALKWQSANPEKRKLSSKKFADAHKTEKTAYRQKNKEKINELKRVWVSSNRALVNEWALKWAKSHPEAIKVNRQNRRAREKNQTGTITKKRISDLYRLQQGKCACCKKLLLHEYHADHIIPLKLEGINGDLNIQLLCKQCNLQKSSKHPIDFMQSKGFLL